MAKGGRDIRKPWFERDLFWFPATLLGAALLVALLFRGFWSSDYFLAGTDTFSHDYPMWAWGWGELLRAREFPLWNPYLFGGWPFVASFAFCPYYPPAWPSVFLPTSSAITSQYALHLALGMAGFYAMCRAMRVAPCVAFALAIMFGSGGHVATLANPGHLAKVQAIAWVGWAMAATLMLGRDARPRRGVALGCCWALMLLASHAQIFYFSVWSSLLCLAAMAIWPNQSPSQSGAFSPERTKRWPRLVKPMAGLVVAGLFCLALSAPQMFPAFEMAQISNRSGGLDYDEASFGGLPPEEILDVAIGPFRGATVRNPTYLPGLGPVDSLYFGRWHANERGEGAERLVSDHAGAATVVLALLGLALSPGRKRFFFSGMLLVSALVSMGDYTPVFKICHRFVPGFSSFRSPATFMIGVHLAVFALAALGAQALFDRLRRVKSSRVLLISGIGLFVIALVFVLLGFVVRSSIYSYIEAHGGADFVRQNPRLGEPLLFRSAFFHSAAILAALHALSGLGLLVMAWLDGRRPMRRFKWRSVLVILFLVAFVTIFAHGQQERLRLFLPRDRTANLEHFLRRHPVESLILRHHRDLGPPTMTEWGNEHSNRPLMRGVRSTHGYHPVVFGNYEKLLRATGSLNSPSALRHFGVNYLVAPRETVPSDEWKLLGEAAGRAVFARREPIPFAFVPLEVVSLSENGGWRDLDESAWRRLLGAESFDPRKMSLVEGSFSFALEKLTRSGTDLDGNLVLKRDFPTDAEIDAFRVVAAYEGSNRVRLRWASGSEDDPIRSSYSTPKGLLPVFLSVPNGPGWRQWSEFEKWEGALRVPPPEPEWPRKANGLFMLAIMDHKAEVECVLEYRPTSIIVGGWAGALGLVALVAFLLTTICRRRA